MPKDKLEIKQCRGQCVLMRINQDSRSWGGAREPDATVQPLNDSAVAVTEMQCNGRTGSFVSTPRAATGTGVYQFDATPTMVNGMQDEKRGRRDRFEWGPLLDRCYSRANFTGIIIERFDRREKQQGMLCGPCR